MPRFLSAVSAIGPVTSTLTPITIGGDTTTLIQGAYFGSDTPLWRVASNVLKTNQLDQVVAPVQTGQQTLELANAGIASGAGASGNFTSFTMPFKGNLAVTGFFVLFNFSAGVGVSTCRFYIASSIATGPQAVFRTSGGSSNEIWTLPMLVHASAIAAGTTITVQYEALNQGVTTIAMSRVAMLWTATRTL